MLKLNKLFLYEDRPEPFGRKIEPEIEQRELLLNCKNKIRDRLREGIRQASVTKLGANSMITPKFRTQGSWSYQTCLKPAFLPPQQMDWDFGVYLPTKTWEDHRPKVAAKAYFELAEELLRDLCEEEGWKLLEGKQCKDTCIRIEVASWAHIDIPLYAAPERQFQQLTERALAKAHAYALNNAQDSVLAVIEDDPFEWQDLDEIMMATRAGVWKPSDPGAVSQWFKDQVETHGEQLRRTCRYVKAWRDYQWPDGGGPSSILLMILVSQGFEDNPRRDDLVLEDAAARLAKGLRGDVYEPQIGDGKEDFNRLDAQERVTAAEKAEALRAALHRARCRIYLERPASIIDLQQQLGDRIPYELDWVEQEAGAADIVRATRATYVASPTVKSTSAG
jgi:hypothetical protein